MSKLTLLFGAISMLAATANGGPLLGEGPLTATFTIGSNETAHRGDSFDISVDFESSVDVNSISISGLTYDTSILTLTQQVNGEGFSGSDGNLSWSSLDGLNTSISGTLTTFTFSVDSAAAFDSETTISFSGAVTTYVDESNNDPLNCSYEGGTIKVVCAHVNTESKEAISADHLNDGRESGTYCNDCGKFIDGGETIPKITEHSFDDWVDCEDDTNHQRICECGEIEIEEHKWDDGEVTDEPTHLAKGEKLYTCTVCGAQKTEEIDELTTHEFGDWVDAGDTKNHKRTCPCGEVETEAHDFEEEIINSSTHYVSGKKRLTCKVCGYSYEETMEKVGGHVYGSWTLYERQPEYHCRECLCGYVEYGEHRYDEGVYIKEPSHQSKGLIKKTCLDCGYVIEEEVDPVDQHVFGDWEYVDYRLHQRVCECGLTETDFHHFDDGVVTTHPTHSKTGILTYTCIECGFTKTESLPTSEDHYYADWENLDETSHKGVCECGEEIFENHCWDEGNVISKAYCGNEGKVVYTCTKCGATKSVVTPKPGEHDFSDWIVDEEATCGKTGKQHKQCRNCGDIVYEEIPITGIHNIVTETIKDPNCTEDGLRITKCYDCGEIIKEEILPKLDHYYNEWVIDKECSCTEDGLKHKACARCGDIVEEIIPAHGHEGGEWELFKKASCAEEGEEVQKCIHCGEIMDHRSIEKTNHEYQNNRCIYCGKSAFSVANTSTFGNISFDSSKIDFDGMLLDAERKAIDNGVTCGFSIGSSDLTSSVSKQDSRLIKKALPSGMKVGLYFDINLMVTVNGVSREITESNGSLLVTLEIPTELLTDDSRTYSIVRVHNGVAETIECVRNNNKISFTSDKFSTYALAYKDKFVMPEFNPIVLVYILGGLVLVGVVAYGVYFVKKKVDRGLHPMQ